MKRRAASIAVLSVLVVVLAGAAWAEVGCRKDVWVYLDCSGSMYLPRSIYHNRVELHGHRMNFLEASARLIDEFADGLAPDINLRIFLFYTTVREVPRTRHIFDYLDSNHDGTITKQDRPGGFWESKTNLVGVLQDIDHRLNALAHDREGVVSILWFTDGDADYGGPGKGGNPSSYLRRYLGKHGAALARNIVGGNAMLELVALRPDLRDAKDIVERLRLGARDRARFIDPRRGLAEVIAKELNEGVRRLTHLDIAASLARVTTSGVVLNMAVDNRSCGAVQAGTAVLNISPLGVERRIPLTFRLASGGHLEDALTFDQVRLARGDLTFHLALLGASGRGLGEIEFATSLAMARPVTIVPVSSGGRGFVAGRAIAVGKKARRVAGRFGVLIADRGAGQESQLVLVPDPRVEKLRNTLVRKRQQVDIRDLPVAWGRPHWRLFGGLPQRQSLKLQITNHDTSEVQIAYDVTTQVPVTGDTGTEVTGIMTLMPGVNTATLNLPVNHETMVYRLVCRLPGGTKGSTRGLLSVEVGGREYPLGEEGLYLVQRYLVDKRKMALLVLVVLGLLGWIIFWKTVPRV